MKNVADIAKSIGIYDVNEMIAFRQFVENQSDIRIEKSFLKGVMVDDADVQKVTNRYIEIKEKAAAEKAKINEATSKILVSSGFNFDGYKITKYSGYISGDDTVQIDRKVLCDYKPQEICDALVKIRIQALKELKEAAYALGCNAVIGVDFDYMTFEPQTANINGGTTYYPYVICVTANGNAVIIEKE